MYDYLVNHALKNVWCTPDQDRQLILQPAKITVTNGVWNNVSLLWNVIKLPLQGVRFHVYQVGQLYPALAGLVDLTNKWIKFSDACNAGNLIIDIYSNSGLQLPRTETWYMITDDRNIVIAVKEQLRINIDLDTDPIFIRTYSNAYFASSRSDPLNDYIKVEGGTVPTTADILSLQQKYNAIALLPGAVYVFVNGFKVSTIDLFSVLPGDIVEYVYDSSIRLVVDIAISTTQTFISQLDSKRKYLLHYPGSGDSSIDYHDDIDFFIINQDTNLRHKGLYYHRNSPDAIRMVTYKDYSMVVPYAVGYVGIIPNATSIDSLIVRMHIRKSGYKRVLTFENNRVEELYKLPDAKLVSAMVGIDSTVPTWTAAALEDSAYVELMRSDMRSINRSLIENAYGYNAISKLLGDTPSNTTLASGRQMINIPYGLVNNSVAYEYDSAGLLINWYQHVGNTIYNAVSNNARQIELISGIGDTVLDEVYGLPTLTVDPSLEYRFYTCPIINGSPDNKWTDVTGTSNYAIINNLITWIVDPLQTYTLIRSNKKILAYDLNLMAYNGLLEFNLECTQVRNNVSSLLNMQIPMGELDVFLNGNSLIEGVDYIVNFPRIIIINKTYLVNVLSATQKITIRFSGFCNADLTRNKQNDSGFIKYDLLSHNNRFDIRDDKVLRIIVGGKLYNRTALLFSEVDSGVTVPNASNGLPYLIKDIIVPLRGLGAVDTYTARAASQVIDKSISDYMTAFLPEPVITAPNVISALYPVYSPFCSRIIYDLQLGIINDVRLTQQYNDTDVMSICEPYINLLSFDLTQLTLQQDPNYVIIHPHNLNSVIALNLYQYKFLSRVVKLYLNNLVDISHFISII
jgi:hypothetical protein